MVPQIREALYITLAPLHVKRSLFVGSQRLSMCPIIHRKTASISLKSQYRFEKTAYLRSELLLLEY